MAIVSMESIVCTEPHEFLVILNDAVYYIVLQAILGGDVLKFHFLDLRKIVNG
jgi:hypothetical protein